MGRLGVAAGGTGDGLGGSRRRGLPWVADPPGSLWTCSVLLPVSGRVFICRSGYVSRYLFLTITYEPVVCGGCAGSGCVYGRDVGFLGHTCAPPERRVLLGFSLEMVSLTDCQVLQVWEENLVPGKSSFIK